MVKRRIAPLIGDQVRLRLLGEEDLPMTLGWRNQEHIRKWFVHSDVLTWEQHQRWCAGYFHRDTDFIFVIEETKSLPKPVGQISLYNIDWEQKRAEYGRLMIGDPEAAGKGLAKAATAVLLNFAFGALGIMEIALEVFSENVPAIAIYRAVGFHEVAESSGLKKMIIKSEWWRDPRE